MGMYDIINGEQVKCFTWVSLYEDELIFHGGDLNHFNTGEEVPYKKPHYNYGKNFVIIDLNRWYMCSKNIITDYQYYLHVIVDGKVTATYKDKIGDIDWENNQNVVDYIGTLLNIHSKEDLENYINDQTEHWLAYDKARTTYDKLQTEAFKYLCGFALLDKEEKEIRRQKIKEIDELKLKEEERIRPELDALDVKINKWFKDISDIKDLIILGNFIDSYEVTKKFHPEQLDFIKNNIKKFLSEDDTLYDRYVEWQGSDEFIKEFKEEK